MSERVSPYNTDARNLAYALFRSNVDWAAAARECGDPDCEGDCVWIREVRRLVREIDGGILADATGSQEWT